MSGIIFPDPNSANMDSDALIIWILEDCSNIPEVSYFNEVYTKLKIALKGDGFDGNVTHRVIIVDPKTDSTDFCQSFDALHRDYLYNCIYLLIEKCKGDKDAKLNWVFVDILRWSFVRSAFNRTTANVVLISGNENFGQGTKFSHVRDTLLNKGFNFALVNPDTLLKIDETCGSCST